MKGIMCMVPHVVNLERSAYICTLINIPSYVVFLTIIRTWKMETYVSFIVGLIAGVIVATLAVYIIYRLYRARAAAAEDQELAIVALLKEQNEMLNDIKRYSYSNS